MKKKFMMLLCALAFTLAGSAQIQDRPPFGVGKFYVSTGLSGLDLNFNSSEKWKLDLNARAGYLFEDNWMVTGQLEYDYRKYAPNTFVAGAGLRYYIEQNGLYLGLGLNYLHQNHTYDDFMPTAHVGYSFFLNRTVTIEPELYYNQSTKNHSDYSGFGFRIGFGIYFE
ncbi:MAG: outer membrane beta-barrel protein [Prevotella sp.]|nr:outer membrane beta-barrel protein [Prevotella sp.]